MANSSKVSFPSTDALKFYYYFSTFTLVLSWLIAPFLLFLIFKKSKELKTFKWFILNHSFWCFAMENIVGFVKPVLFTPAPAGYSIGILQGYGSLGTGLGFIIGMVITANCIFGVLATIGNRYLSIFPSKLPKWLNSRIISAFGIVFLLIFCAGIGVLCFGAVYYNTSVQTSKEYDPFFEDFHEPSLFFPPPSVAIPFVFYGNLLLISNLLACFLTTIYFVYLVRKHLDATTTKLQKSLIISCIVQILLTCGFLIFPFALGFTLISLQLPHTATITCLKYCAVSSHFVMESISLIFFVAPYRNFSKSLLYKFFKMGTVKPILISQSTVTR